MRSFGSGRRRATRGFCVLALLLAAAGAGAARASAAVCGLPEAQPLFIDFHDGSVKLTPDVFRRPGLVLAASGGGTAIDLRSAGAQTVYWEMNLGGSVGSPTAPADPAVIAARADALFAKAVTGSACQTPVIGLNELIDPGVPAHGTLTIDAYRANVLAFLQRLAADGAQPYLLVPRSPSVDGDAAAWWQAVASVSSLALEVYFSAPSLDAQGPILASRTVRTAFRTALGTFGALGIPAARLGLVLGFQRQPGGRDGLQPATAWFRTVKWQALAARQVAAETPFGTVWSWGWRTEGANQADPDKTAAACVYLWTRDPTLCSGPSLAGPGFDGSLTEGQLIVPAGAQCVLGDGTLLSPNGLAHLTAVYRGVRAAAYTTLLLRAVERTSPAPRGSVPRVERGIVRRSFGGRRARYLAALAAAGSNVGDARAILADEIRAQGIGARRTIRPSAARIRAWYRSHRAAVVRRVLAPRSVALFGARRQGYLFAGAAPAGFFVRGVRRGTVATEAGGVAVVTRGRTTTIRRVPLRLVSRSIAALIAHADRAAAAERARLQAESTALASITCLGDDVPAAASVDTTAPLPFLRLDG
jgi:hypothetical protein